MEQLKKGCVVFMKASSGLTGYGNAQCVSWVSHEIGELGLYGHNEGYKTYDVDRIIECPNENEISKKDYTHLDDQDYYAKDKEIEKLKKEIEFLNENTDSILSNVPVEQVIEQEGVSNALPDLKKSTENWDKIKDKDEWLNEIRGREDITNEEIKEVAERYALSKGYVESDKEVFQTTYWTQRNIAIVAFIAGAKYILSQSVDRGGEADIIDKIDTYLAYIEDFAHGDVGMEVTKIRGKIQEYINQIK